MADNTSKNTPGKKSLPCIWGGALLAILVSLLIINTLRHAFVYIKPDERGVVITALEPAGLRAEPLESGVHILIPVAEQAIIYSIAPQTYTLSDQRITGQPVDDTPVVVKSRDGKDVSMDVSVVYMIDPSAVIDMHISWQDRYPVELVRPLVIGISRDVASQHYASDITGPYQSKMELDIAEQLRQQFSENGLTLIDFTIHHARLASE